MIFTGIEDLQVDWKKWNTEIIILLLFSGWWKWKIQAKNLKLKILEIHPTYQDFLSDNCRTHTPLHLNVIQFVLIPFLTASKLVRVFWPNYSEWETKKNLKLLFSNRIFNASSF